MNLTVQQSRRAKYNSYKGEISPAVENLIKRDFKSERPNEKWLTDITEFGLPEGKVYLSPVIDCFDGLPVAWTIGTSPNATLVNKSGGSHPEIRRKADRSFGQRVSLPLAGLD